jgi:class 3 adenylate cyclase/tetratricopeptide (TPR) repeat protein
MTTAAASPSTQPGPPADGARAGLYVPRILQQHLAADPQSRWWQHEGTAVFSDISGFTRLSEQLARKGREGSEQITEVIGKCFESILAVAYDNGASLLKFGGDALLLWFQDKGHAARACRAAVLMRRALRDVGRIDLPGARTTLRMSQGVHTGDFHFFMVGTTHHELVVAGPGWSRVVRMEHEAVASEILVSPETAALLPPRCLGGGNGPGVQLRREPPGRDDLPLVPRPNVAHEVLARCLSPAVRAHVTGGGGAPEHRPVTVAFIKLEGIDALIATRGPQAAADVLQRVVTVVESATEAQRVALLASDIDVDGGKLILTAGAPIATGEDEERMLLALRGIVDAGLPVDLRIGVNRGAIFAGDIGPFYRRTYTVMGDVVNLAARLMAKAPPGRIYATAEVLDRSNTLFAATALEPFAVKGKARPVAAWDVGKATGSRTRHGTLQALPLTGRDGEMSALREALAAARAGRGHVFELVGEAGVGKSRLAGALREEAADVQRLHAVCEAYTASTPYAVWQEVLRGIAGIARDEAEDAVAARVREIVAARAPALLPWLPLIAIAFGVEASSTPEVDMLAESNRRQKLHETVVAFLDALVPGVTLVELENAHHMDVASAELLAYIAQSIGARPWLVVTARRPADARKPPAPGITRLELAPLAAADTLRLAKHASERHPLPAHVIELVAQRSGGNPQFLRDLLRAAIESGGTASLPDSAEAAAMARIDALTPDDRAVLRRAAVFGLTFHPRMLEWLGAGDATPSNDAAVWQRLHEFFDDEGDGYLRFRRALMRDAAYQGLPFKLRREYHGAAARHMEDELAAPEDEADLLSLHYLVAGDSANAWRYASIAAGRAMAAFAYVEAAAMFSRALEAARKLDDVGARELAVVHESLGDCWYRAGEMGKAADAFTAAQRLADDDRLKASELMLKRSHLEHKLGRYSHAMSWATRAGKAVEGMPGDEPARFEARVRAWHANILQAAGRTSDAMRAAGRAIEDAEATGDPEALGAACFVMGWALGALGKPGAEPCLQRALAAYVRSGNRLRQAALLSNLGVICQWEGRWDEALSYYERARADFEQLGSNIDATLARMNLAEILSDRGELDEAQSLLQDALLVWRGSRYRYLLGGCLWLLGRVSLRAGRIDEALARLTEARALFVAVKREEEVLDVDARIAECRLFRGERDAATRLLDEALARARASKAGAKALTLLERVRGHALLQRRRFEEAADALEASLASARARNDLQDTMLALHSLVEACRREGRPPPEARATELDALAARLSVRALPPIPP